MRKKFILGEPKINLDNANNLLKELLNQIILMKINIQKF